jgi:DNA-binding CsgD family transcriptional regulator
VDAAGAAYACVVDRSAAYERSRADVVRRCDTAADTDERTLRRHVLDEIRRVVAFDWHVWLLTDPETSVGSAPLAEIPPPLLVDLPRLIRLKYLTRVNRWTTLISPVASLSDATGGDLAQSLVWHELLSSHGVVDVASLVFTDRFGCWGFLDLWRTGAASSFTSDDLGFLARISDPVTTAIRRCQAATFATASAAHRDWPGPMVLLLSPELDMLGQTPETHEYLRLLMPPSDGHAPVPAGAYNVAAQLLAVEAGVDSDPPSARVHLSDGLWLTLRGARIGHADPPGQRSIAVTIERASPDERMSLLARAYGLSARESEVLQHLMTGLDTREVARRMFLSEHTVQDHLKSIFSKTSVHSRRTLLSRALGA